MISGERSVHIMTMMQYIDACMAVKKMSKRKLAVYMGQSPQNLNSKFQRESFRPDEIMEIAEALGASVRFIDNETGKPIV